MPGFRHVDRGIFPPYAESIQVKTFPSGERRIRKDPPRKILEEAFHEFGTLVAVANAFGVGRSAVGRWLRDYKMEVDSHPEAGLARVVRQRLNTEIARVKVAQWLMDEGSVSVTYFRRGDYTILLVCGSMNDYSVLGSISKILDTPITSSKTPGTTTLPMGAIRVQSARAYALLEVLGPHLVGLKALEGKAALQFSPASGILRGRHTTDEFLLPVWKEFSLESLNQWNKGRRVKTTQQEVLLRAEEWLEGRIKRARRFVDSQGKQRPKR